MDLKLKQKLNVVFELIKTLINKVNLKSIIRSLCLMLCSIGFLYQTSLLVAIYMSGKSVVETRFERLRYSQLPAITICLPFFLDMDKFAYSYLKDSPIKREQEIYQSYKSIMNKWDKRNWTNSDEQDYHSNSFEMMVNYVGKRASYKLREMFNKMAVDEIKQVYYNYREAFNESGYLIIVAEPIQVRSIVPLPYYPVLCFTVFSDNDKNFRNIKYNLDKLEIHFMHDQRKFPLSRYESSKDSFLFALHSPNSMVKYRRYNIFFQLKMGMSNYVTYSESQIKLLAPPYLTNCKNYDTFRGGSRFMRSDCINGCINRKMEEEFHLGCIWDYENFRLMREHDLDVTELKVCDFYSMDFSKAHNISRAQLAFDLLCQDHCPKNCWESFYNFDVHYPHKVRQTNEFSIMLEHNRFLDQIIEHKPIMNWISLVSDIGGLSGLWLGLSFLLLCEEAMDRIFARSN